MFKTTATRNAFPISLFVIKFYCNVNQFFFFFAKDDHITCHCLKNILKSNKINFLYHCILIFYCGENQQKIKQFLMGMSFNYWRKALPKMSLSKMKLLRGLKKKLIENTRF